MGGLSSKLGRIRPTATKSPASRPFDLSVSRQRTLAREKKDPDIERDGKDPHLLANLGRLGQVNVRSGSNPNLLKMDQVSNLYNKRAVSEQQASSAMAVRNRLDAAVLSNMLDDRKFVTSRSELEKLADRYTIDVSVLQNLVKSVNTPSIDEGTVLRTVGAGGEESITMQAVWVDPSLKDT